MKLEKKLKPYLNTYKLIIKTSQKYDENGKNIFILTAERLLEYKDLPKIDFLIIDEFYKLSCKREDDRSNILNNAFYILLEKYKVKFLLLGPNIKNVSTEFLEKYNAEFYKTNYSLVVNQEINLFNNSKK